MADKIIEDEKQEVSEMMRAGTYFREARAWYQTLYISPISERTLFLIVAILAGLVGLTGVVAVASLLPITEHPGIIVNNDRIDDDALILQHMRTAHKEALNPAIREFMAQEYVSMRESFDPESYAKNYAFIHAHSDDPTFAVYAQGYAPTNPQSPLITLGEFGRRWVDVKSVEINDSVEPKTATVKFSTETLANNVNTTTQWTAVIGFYYSDLVVTPVRDSATGETHTQTQEPVFQVVSYVVAPTAPAAQ